MPTLLKCPSCSAPLDLHGRAGEIVTCSFCGQTIRIPDLDDDAPRPAARRSPVAVIVLAIVIPAVLLLVGGVAVAVLALKSSPASPPARPLAEPPRPVAPKPPETKPPAKPAFATPVLSFGSDGIGPGQFKDNRSVAVDRDGRIYSADYSEGRLQVFDAEGKFLTQWPVDPDRALVDLLADRAGRVYVLYPNLLVVYDGASGQILRSIDGFWADAIALAPDNRLIALAGDEIRQFDETGKVLGRIEKLKERASAKRAQFEAIAVDGLGNYYVAEQWSTMVYKFDRTGAFVDKFGGETDHPDYFRYPNDVAVDGQGRVYVSTVGRIRVFDASGTRVDDIEMNQAFGMAFDDSGALYVANRPKVTKLRIDR